MNSQTNLLFNHSINCPDGTTKQLQICHGDLCETSEQYDVLICSAFKNRYYPLKNTLIGSLWEKKGISVEELAQTPEIDLRNYGCWVSHSLEANFKRLACVELLDPNAVENQDLNDSITLKSTFSTLRFLLETLATQDKSVRSIALPILGSGNQSIELCYIVPPLLTQCIAALETIPQLETITFYELNETKALELKKMCTQALSKNDNVPHVFISYSSKQQPLAYQLKDLMNKNNVSCWMAPESIPTGSSYQSEIPSALSKIPIVLLILSPEAENSRWVQNLNKAEYTFM